MKAIETHKLTKYYGTSRGIIDLDLSVDKGEFFGFIGPNGAGKSTLIRTLLGLIQPTSGSASICGIDIVKNKTRVLAKVGYVPADAAFYKGMKVKDILRYSAKIRGVDCSEYADLLCERMELDTSRPVDALSYGNKKKVAIVCAMQHQPDLYILDEPTSGLDKKIRRYVK